MKFRFKDPKKYGGCLAADISDGGMKVSLNNFVPVDTELSLEVQLASQRIVDCVANIVWIEKMPYMDRYQVGLKFKEERFELDSKKEIHLFTHSSKE